jgi:indole-3-glycerol phosphate synthase
MNNILEKILLHKQQEIILAKRAIPLADLEAKVTNEKRGFINAIKQRIQRRKPAVIAEIKKASPSKGVLRENFDPIAIAQDFEQAGATCLSVLTDSKFFQGSNAYLQQISQHTQLPLLRKDFIIDPYQIFESNVIGADCILLIVAALTDKQLSILAELARELSLDVLVEVHNAKELDRALKLNTPLIGINNRDLTTFETSLNTTLTLLQKIPTDRLIIAESGIQTPDDVKLMLKHHVYGFLVGESLMRYHMPGVQLRSLFNKFL